MGVVDFSSTAIDFKLSSELGVPGVSSIRSYEEGIRKYSLPARKTLHYYSLQDNLLTGGNCFSQPIFETCLPYDWRLARMPDFRWDKENDPFSREYEANVGLVLRSHLESWPPNKEITESLSYQLWQKGFSFEIPLLIYFDALDVVEDFRSYCGLNYRLKDSAERGVNIFEASEFSHKNNGKRFFDLDVKGMPIFDDEGDKVLRTRPTGLSRCFLRKGNLHTDIQDLVVPSGIERVFVTPRDISLRKGKILHLDDYR